jgi:Xaa-Pro aminopeptidase
MDFKGRQKRLRSKMENGGVDALLVTHLPNVRYLCGFTGSAGILVITQRSAVFFTDGRYELQASREVQNARVTIAKGPTLIAAAKIAARSKSIGIEAEHLSVASRKIIAGILSKGLRLKDTCGFVELLRMIKEPEEVSLIRQAVDFGSDLLPVAIAALKPGARETEVAAEIEYAARKRGAEGMSFETIIAAGQRSALPHGVASSATIPSNGYVVMDFGVILHGYCSDMTRTVHLGVASREERSLYQAVFSAQQAGIEACRPGITLAEVDAAARSELKRSNLDRYFAHSTGHGLGLEIHEPPRLARGQDEVLQPGMVVTIEPGIYLAGQCGIRIEDVVVMTEQGHEVLTRARKELIEL